MPEENILAVETSGRHGSVAVACGSRLLAERDFPTDREHARELLPVVDELCREQGWTAADLDHCYLSIGPGSFTGLRVAVTFARHLALATGTKICAVPTLDTIVENCATVASPPLRVAAILDAKRGQVFAAVYQKDLAATLDKTEAGLEPPAYRRIVEPCLIEPAKLFSTTTAPIAVIGEGIDYHLPAIQASGAEILDRSLWRPRASCVHRLGRRLAQSGQFTTARMLMPFYLRRPEAEELWEKRHGIAGTSTDAPPP